uniref:Rab-GAP TBC domain-containing protein n=1 Tax=Macrostomum lignano TaxID=282301 RepID=A0A1I8F4Z2_9PLAT
DFFVASPRRRSGPAPRPLEPVPDRATASTQAHLDASCQTRPALAAGAAAAASARHDGTPYNPPTPKKKWLGHVQQLGPSGPRQVSPSRLLASAAGKAFRILCEPGWYYLCGACFMQRDQPDLYWMKSTKDLSRQFPHHELFVQDQGHGQQALRRLLQAYSGCHPEVGYCQAMAPLAGALLLHMPELDAFYTMVSLLRHPTCATTSRPGLEAVQVDGQILYGLVLKRMYPDVYRHLVKYKVEPLHFMVDWFMCLYVREPALANAALDHSEDTLDCLRNLPASVTEASSLLPTALLLELSAKDFEQEHTKQLKKFNHGESRADTRCRRLLQP